MALGATSKSKSQWSQQLKVNSSASHKRPAIAQFQTNSLDLPSSTASFRYKHNSATMSGRGKGGKGLGKGGAKRHRKVLRDNIQGEQSLQTFFVQLLKVFRLHR